MHCIYLFPRFFAFYIGGELRKSILCNVNILTFLLRKREERLNKNSEGVSEVLSWVSWSRKLEEKRNAEKKKALQLSKIFEEQVLFQ